MLAGGKYKKEYSLSLGRVILSSIILISFYQAAGQDSSQQLKSNNTVSDVAITFKIDPESGKIYCYKDEQKNALEVSNKNETYPFGTRLYCQVQTRNNYNFSSWSGLATSSDNPITFRVLQEGKLNANLNKPSQVPSVSWQEISETILTFLSIHQYLLIAPLIATVILGVWYYRSWKIYNSYIERIETACEESKDNKEECFQRLEPIIDELTHLFKKGKIKQKYYEMIINKILEKSEKIKRTDTESKEEPLDSFARALSELITLYENISPLTTLDFSSILKKTTKSTKMNTYLKGTFKSFFVVSYGKSTSIPFADLVPYLIKRKEIVTAISDRGGYLSSLLFKRRIRKVLNTLIASCHIALSHERDPKKVQTIQGIIKKIVSSKEILLTSTGQGFNKIDLVLRLIPIILSFFAPTILTTLFSPLVVSLPSIPLEYLLYFFYGIYLISFLLITRYIVRVIWWYNKIIRIYRIDEKERCVYDHLLSI